MVDGNSAGTDIILEDAQAVKDITQILTDTNVKANERHNNISKIVVNVLHRFGYFYHVIDKMEFNSVYYFDKRKKSLLMVQSDEFQAGISERFGINMASPVFKYVMAECETEGLSNRSTSIKLSTFWEMKSNNIYISNSPGTMIKITKNSVKMVDNGTDGVLFPRGSTLQNWVYNQADAKDPFEICELFNTISVTEPYMVYLFKAWVCSHPTNPLSKPPICVTGAVGSGKTRLLMGVHELWGTTGSPVKCQWDKDGEKDFWILTDRGGFLLLDNVDNKIPWLADAISACTTGGSSEKRTLHTSKELTKLYPRAWVGLSSANPEFAADTGTADRLLVVRLNRRTGETKEKSLRDDIAKNRNRGLSWICQTLSRALNDTKPVPNQLNARHPDFATLAVRIGRQFTSEQNIVDALIFAEMDKSTFNMENDEIGATIKEYFEQTESNVLTGTAAEMVEKLKGINPDLYGGKNRKELTARGFGNRLKTIMPHLETLYRAKKSDVAGNKTEYIFYKPKYEIPPEKNTTQETLTGVSDKLLKEAKQSWNNREPKDREQAVITALVDSGMISKQMVYSISRNLFEIIKPEHQMEIAKYLQSKGTIKGE